MPRAEAAAQEGGQSANNLRSRVAGGKQGLLRVDPCANVEDGEGKTPNAGAGASPSIQPATASGHHSQDSPGEGQPDALNLSPGPCKDEHSSQVVSASASAHSRSASPQSPSPPKLSKQPSTSKGVAVGHRKKGAKTRTFRQRIPPAKLDSNDPGIRKRFKQLSKQLRLNEEKLQAEVKKHFSDQAENVMQVLRKQFGNFKTAIDYRHYFEIVQRFVSSEASTCNEIFFHFLDVGKDRKVCETDLFLSLKSLTTFRLLELMSDDIMICMSNLERLRAREGKQDPEQMRREQVRLKIQSAIEQNKKIEKEDRAGEVKEFLREVVHHQEEMKRAQEEALSADDLAEKLAAVPNRIKPYLHTEINFSVFVALLSDKVDPQRVSLGPKQFKEIEFSCGGYPRVLIETFSFLTNLP